MFFVQKVDFFVPERRLLNFLHEEKLGRGLLKQFPALSLLAAVILLGDYFKQSLFEKSGFEDNRQERKADEIHLQVGIKTWQLLEKLVLDFLSQKHV